MAKKKYWLINQILQQDADYNIVYGGRSDGKSYGVKHHCAEEAIDPFKKFIYLRRWDKEIKQASVEQYFGDLDFKRIYGEKASGIRCWAGKIYVTKYDEKSDSNKNWLHIGYTASLSTQAHTTGGAYPDVENIIYEEFVSRDYYLPKEPSTLQDFVSTIARDRRIKVWMVGNTITRFCPYFSDWELKNVPKQRQGTIDLYRIATGNFDDNNEPIFCKLAVEYTAPSGSKSTMFFGETSKMITEGGWQTEIRPHLDKRLEKYEIVYTIVVVSKKYMFLGRYLYDEEASGCFWYFERKTTEIKSDTRVVADYFNPSPLYTIGFVPLTQEERQIFNDITNRKVVYSDNLTGTEFIQACRALQDAFG